MTGNGKSKATIKFVFWLAASMGVIIYIVSVYASGQMARWYYYTAAEDGYAVNASGFMDATKEKPAVLKIDKVERLEGLVTVPVKKGERLPDLTNGLITQKELEKGKRAVLDGASIKVTVPWEIKETKGFKYKDTFKHKGIKTNPWAGAWNVLMVLLMGFTLGMLAEGFTDLLGLKLEKIHHEIGH